MSAAVSKLYTPEDLLTMPDGNKYELVNGELVEKPMGWKSSLIGGNVFYLLLNYLRSKHLGRAAPADASYQCFPDAPKKVRRPDTSFISYDRLPADRDEPEGHCRIAPNLAVEVISPNETYSEVEAKIDEYLGAGVQLVWVIDPQTRTVRIHRANGTVTDVGPTGVLSGEDVLPDFQCKVEDLFLQTSSKVAE